MAFRIRPATAGDTPATLQFILALQRFEHAFEPNRRLDAAVAKDYHAKLMHDVAERDGSIFIAEDAAPIGWAVVHDGEDELFVVESERRFAYIAELFVVEEARGTGVGRALIAACEGWARTRGHRIAQIGVLPGNSRARTVYERAGFAPYTMQLRRYL